MGATLATVAAICKEIYEPRVRKQLNDEAKTLKRIQKSSDGVESNVGGRYVTFPIQTRRNSGIGARNELEALPAAGQQGYTSARVGLKYLYGRINLSGPTIKLVDTNAQAFASALDREVNGIKTDLVKDQNRQVYGDGSGAVGVLVTAAASNTQTVLNSQYLQLGEQIDIIDGTTLGNPNPTVKASNRQITAINVATNQFTFDGATQAVVNGDIVVRTGNVNREWTGLAKIVNNTGTLYNIDPTVEGTWKAEVDSNAGVNRALSEGLMILMADRVYTNGGKTTAIYANLGVRRAYFNLLSQQRMYTGTKDFGGGFTGLSFTTDNGDIPFFTDVDAPPNTLYFLNEDEFTLFREEDWSFADMDGNMWQRVIGFDAYEAFLYQYSELGCHRRNSQGVIKDITEG
jgi:hypothetical protein